ncbi:MAG: InlB B-repeat-containing protein, partial [Spirochaetales bacterium]|nr:InlB B-repeat-containing protein [Candidatus Physcosoma equi]
MNRMRNHLLTALIVLMMLFSAVSCSKAPELTISYQANYEGKGELLSQTVASGKKLETPAVPTREGYT